MTLFILFVVLNLFFLSILFIGLYKFICYEKQNELLQIDLLFKCSFFYFFYDEYLNVNDFFMMSSFLGSSFNKIFFYDFLLENHFSIYIDYTFFTFLNFLFYSETAVQNGEHQQLNLIFLNFYIRSSHLNLIQSLSLQKTMIINCNESSLFLFIIYNPSHVHLKMITLYMIYPNTLTLHINKIQCFCFNTLLLSPLEIVVYQF